jgi:hypothetical protein
MIPTKKLDLGEKPPGQLPDRWRKGPNNMKNGIFKWSLITILILSSPLIYTELQGYISLHVAFPAYAALSTKSLAALSTILIGSGAIGAILTAAVVALPSAYLAREKSKMVCIVLVLVTQAIPVCTFFQQPMIKSCNYSAHSSSSPTVPLCKGGFRGI